MINTSSFNLKSQADLDRPRETQWDCNLIKAPDGTVVVTKRRQLLFVGLLQVSFLQNYALGVGPWLESSFLYNENNNGAYLIRLVRGLTELKYIVFRIGTNEK